MKTVFLFALVCLAASGAVPDPKLRLALNWKPEPEFGGFYVSEAFKKAGLDVTVLPGGVGTPVVQMVPAGKVEFGIVSADELVIAKGKGADIVALFAVYQTSPMAILTHEARGFKHLKEVFESGTLAIQRGLPFSVFLEKKFGFSRMKVVPYLGGVAQFLTDPQMSIQGFVTAEPISARRNGAKVKTFLISDAGFNPYTTVVAARKTYVEKNPELVKKMVSAIREGWKSYLENPKAANTVMAKLNPTMDAATFQESSELQKPFIETDETRKSGLGSMTDERWKALAAQMVEMKLADKAVEPGAYYQNIP